MKTSFGPESLRSNCRRLGVRWILRLRAPAVVDAHADVIPAAPAASIMSRSDCASECGMSSRPSREHVAVEEIVHVLYAHPSLSATPLCAVPLTNSLSSYSVSPSREAAPSTLAVSPPLSPARKPTQVRAPTLRARVLYPKSPTRPHGNPNMNESEKVVAKKTFSSEM